MQSLLLRKAGVLATLLLFLVAPASGVDKFKRIAVMPFENITQEKALDWVGGGIAELLTTDLGKFSDFTLVERSRLNDALKEIKLGQSASVNPATAQKMGKILGADSIIVGSFQKFQDEMRIVARVIETETAEVRSTARVDGAYKNLLSLQNDISVKLVEEMKGSLAEADKRKLEALPSKNLDAVQALSDGAYFLRNDLLQDAVKEFDRAIALDSHFTEAHYYKGVALARLKQWDEAIASLKRTLPRTTNERRVKWSWDPPFEAQGSQRGLFLGIDQSSLSSQGPATAEDAINAQKEFAYSERSGNKTILHFVHLAKRNATRVEISDDNIPIGIGPVNATDSVTVMPAVTPELTQAGSMGLYGISPEGGVLWHADLAGAPGKQADFDVQGNNIFEFYPNTERIVALDATTHQKKWERDHFIAQTWWIRITGDLVLLRSYSDNKFHAIRLSNGEDVWTVDYPPASNYQLVTDQALIVFEPNRRVFAVDLKTGKVFMDLPAPPLMIGTNNPYIFSVPSLVQDNLLYFVSAANEFYAVDLSRSTPANRQIRWKTPLQVKIQSFRKQASLIYAGAESGEFLIVDAATGSVQTAKKVAERNLSIVYAGDNTVLGNTNSVLLALDPKSGNKQWEYANISDSPGYFKGVVVVRPSPLQIALLDAASGNVIWQYAGSPILCRVKDDSVFVIEANGVKEYALDRNVSQGITNKEAMTELASVLFFKGDLDEAERLAVQVARDADPNYPPLRLLQARLSQARGNTLNARGELATYTDLVGRQSKAGQEAIADLKRNAGLIWQAEVGGQFSEMNPDVVDGKILGVGPSQIAVLDASTGKALWRHNVERNFDFLYDGKSKRVFYAYGQNDDPKVVHLYVLGIDGANRRELAHFTGSADVRRLFLAFANNRLFTATSYIDRNSGTFTLDVAAFDASSGTRLWQKTHPYTASEMAQIGVSFGLFFPRGNFLVYSSGKNFWILQGENGEVYSEGHESEPINGEKSRIPSSTVDPDLVFFRAGVKEVVVYRLSSKKEVFRTKISGQDPGFSPCACSTRGTTLFEIDGSDIEAYDLAPGLADASRIIWRLPSGPGQRFILVRPREDSLMAVRMIAGAATLVDATILQLDPATGKILKEFHPLWAPSDISVSSDHMYAFTPDGMAYAMDAK
jgi:outer membrane protein assembly factor BamB/TolB-like protein